MKIRTIRFLLAAVLLLAAVCLPVWAESGSCGEELSWSLAGGTLTVSGSGAMEDYEKAENAPWYAEKSNITKVIFEGATYVGSNAFRDYDSLRSVEFGDVMRELGAFSFHDCDSLTYLRMPKSFKIFGEECLSKCGNLAKIYCAGNFPSFRGNSLWNDYVEIYYPSNNPWPQELITTLETNFKGRIQFFPADEKMMNGTAEEAENDEPVETRPAETVATEPAQTVATVATEPPTMATEPVVTEPPTVVTTVPPTAAAPTVPTAAPVVQAVETAPSTAAAETQPAATAAAAEAGKPSQANLKVAIILCAAAFAVLLIGMLVIAVSANSKKSRRGGRYDR